MSGLTKKAPTMITNKTAATLMATIVALKLALSWMPFTRMIVTITTMMTAGRSMKLPVAM